MNGQSASGQLLHGMTLLALVIHIAGGAIGLVSGTIAVFARKGGYVHRKAGTVFVVSMLIMALFAIFLGFAIPDQITNVFIGTFAMYLVATAWMTVRRKAGTSSTSRMSPDSPPRKTDNAKRVRHAHRSQPPLPPPNPAAPMEAHAALPSS